MAKAEYRSAIRSRRLISVALGELLQEKPLDKITVTDVVTRAEINRGTFYAHYRDIPDAIEHMLSQILTNLWNAAFETSRPMEEIPHVLLCRLRELLEEDLELYRRVMTSGASVMMEQKLVELVMDYFMKHEKEFSNGDRNQYFLTIRFCAGGLSNLYRDWFAGEIPLSLEELTTQAEQLLCGIMEVTGTAGDYCAGKNGPAPDGEQP